MLLLARGPAGDGEAARTEGSSRGGTVLRGFLWARQAVNPSNCLLLMLPTVNHLAGAALVQGLVHQSPTTQRQFNVCPVGK